MGMKWILTAFVLLICAACAPQLYWRHVSKGQQDFYRDNSQCMALGGYGNSNQIVAGSTLGMSEAEVAMQNAQMASAARAQRKRKESIYEQCMMGNGWELVRDKPESLPSPAAASSPAANIISTPACLLAEADRRREDLAAFRQWLWSLPDFDLNDRESSCRNGRGDVVESTILDFHFSSLK